MTPEPMIVQHDDRAIYHRRRWERTERSEICIADSFEHPNRCDWRCSHDREGCIRRTRNNSVGRDHVEIFVRPMRYKGCRQAHNAQVVICALFTTRSSLKFLLRSAGTVQISCRGRFWATAFPEFRRSAQRSECKVPAPAPKRLSASVAWQ